MKKIIYYFAIAGSLFVAGYVYFVAYNDATGFQLVLFALLGLFLLIFGLYGLKAESLMKKFIAQGKTENFCVEVNYYVRNKGILGKIFLFPFIKIKSKNSLVISFLGSVAWMIIILIAMKLFIK